MPLAFVANLTERKNKKTKRMNDQIASLEKQLRLKQVELDEQRSNVDDLYKLLLLTPSAANLVAAQPNLKHSRDAESPDSVRHQILARNVREFTLSKSMELSQQIHPIVSSKSRELLNRLTNAIAPKHHRFEQEYNPLFNSPVISSGGGDFVSAAAESSCEIEEIIRELFRQMEAAEQLEGLFDQISSQNSLLKQQLESVEGEHKSEIKAIKDEHSKAILELKSRNQQSEDYIMKLENELACQKQMVSDLKSASQGTLKNYQSTLQNVSSLLANTERTTAAGSDPEHERKTKSALDSPMADNSFEIRTTAQHNVEHFTDEVERETLKSQIRTLQENMLVKHNSIVELSEKLHLKDQTISKLEEMLEKAEWVVDEKFKMSSKSSNSYQSKFDRLRAEISTLQQANIELERAAMEKEGRLFELQSAGERLQSNASLLETECGRLKSELAIETDRYCKDLRTNEDNMRKLTGQLAELQNEKSDLETKILEYEADLGTMRAKIKQNCATIEELRDLLHKKEISLKQTVSENDRLRQSLSESCHQVAFLQEQLENAKSSNSKLNDELDQARSNFSVKANSKDNEMHQLRQKLSEVMLDRQKHESNAIRLKDECTRLNDDLTRISAEFNKAKADLYECENRLAAVDGDLSAANRDKNDIQAHVNELQMRLDAAKCQSSELATQNAQLTDVNIALNADVERLAKEITSVNGELEQAKIEISAIKMDKSGLAEELDSVRANQSKFVRRNDELISELELNQQKFQAELSNLEIAARNNSDLLSSNYSRASVINENIERLSNDGHSVRQTSLNLSDEFISIEGRISRLQHQMVHLSAQSDEEIFRLARETRDLQQSLAEKDRQMRSLKSQFDESHSCLQAELKLLKDQAGKAEDEFIAQTKNCESLENEVAELRCKLDQSEAALFRNEESYRSEKSKISQDAKDQYIAMERKVTELQELNNQQSSQIFELESELAEVMQKLVHVQTSRDQMEVELAEMSAVISGFEEMQNDCQSWKERFLAIKAETSQRISELQNQLASDRDSFEKELCLLNDIVDQEKADREQVMTGLSEMQGRYNEQSEQIIALQKSKDAADADISNLREQLARSNQEHQKLLCESKAAQQRLDLTITDLDGIKSSLSSKQHEVESLERALALKQDLVRDQQQSLDALADAIQQHKNDLAEKSTELTRERQETVQLKDALARLTAELNARWNQRRQDSTTQTQANDSEEEEAAERILMKLQLEEMQRRAQILEAERADLLVTMDGAEIKSKQTLDILRAELEQVSQNYSHFESLAGELHQANEELRQSLDAAQDQNESMRRQLAILQTMRDEAQLDSRRYQELVSQSELKIAQLTDTIQELELRGAYQDKSMEMSRQNQQQLQAMEKTLQELNADRQSLEKSRKQYKKYALSLEHKVADKEQQIEQLTSRYEICAKEVARLQQDSIEKESETQSLTKRLAEAAVALKEDAAGPLKESDLDFDSTARDFEFSKQVTPDNTKARSEALLEKLVLPDGVDKQRIEKVLRSISHLSIPEIVCRYESKLHKLHVWVEKGEKELSSGVQMIMMKSRTKRV